VPTELFPERASEQAPDLSPEPALRRLSDVIARLIGPDGCPWDKEQTPASLTEYLIEECFELTDAVRSKQAADVCEELGDVLFLLVFVSRLYANRGDFTLADALDGATAKMIRRHPHVFGDTQLADRQALFDNWERIKREEKSADPEKPKTVFSGLPRSLPPLTKAYRIHAKAAGAGFTWPEDEEVERQVEAEWLELLDAQVQGDARALAREFGDHLFSLVEFGRRKGIKAAAALDAAANRFLDRFARMEAMAKARGLDFASLSLDDKDELWEAVKAAEARP
jgi:ATP diphosphatase